MAYQSLEQLLCQSYENVFGSYRIEGLCFLINKITGDNLESSLYYHNDSNNFLLVKKYKSGKYHIDFFQRVDMEEFLYSKNQYVNGEIIDVAECHQGNHSKFMTYDSIKNAYVVKCYDGMKSYQTIFWI
jgi:hypothetical protein